MNEALKRKAQKVLDKHLTWLKQKYMKIDTSIMYIETDY